MPLCTNRPRALASLLALLAAASLAACGTSEEGGRFEISEVDASWSNGRMTVRFRQELSLSGEARNALVHGVPLTVGVELVVRDARSQTRVHRNDSYYEIRYLPLSEHYQLSDPETDTVQTFPRLRHALASLGSLQVSFDTGALPSGEYELLARSFLDKRRVPPPMRLPALFSPQWKHESTWTSWPLSIQPGA